MTAMAINVSSSEFRSKAQVARQDMARRVLREQHSGTKEVHERRGALTRSCRNDVIAEGRLSMIQHGTHRCNHGCNMG